MRYLGIFFGGGLEGAPIFFLLTQILSVFSRFHLIVAGDIWAYLAGAIPWPVSFYDVSLCRCDLPRTDKMSISEITNYSVTLNGELAIATWCKMRNDKVVRIVYEISLLLPCRL